MNCCLSSAVCSSAAPTQGVEAARQAAKATRLIMVKLLMCMLEPNRELSKKCTVIWRCANALGTRLVFRVEREQGTSSSGQFHIELGLPDNRRIDPIIQPQ